MDWLIGENAWAQLAGWVEAATGIAPQTLANLLHTVLVVVGGLLLRWLLLRALLRNVTEAKRRYAGSKAIGYAVSLVSILLLFKIWLAGRVELFTYLGFVSAGLTIALQDPITNIAGWLFLVMRQPFRVGDRIQIGDHMGDVIDIRLFSFSMLEVGNWVQADQSTGRIIHHPNGTVFRESVANHTQGFQYLWHEMPVVVTFESDWEKADKILSAIADAENTTSGEIAEQVHRMAEQFEVTFKHLTPIVWVDVVDIGVRLTVRFLCPSRGRRAAADRVWRKILTAFAKEPTIDFAYPTQRFYDNSKEGKPGAGGPQ